MTVGSGASPEETVLELAAVGALDVARAACKPPGEINTSEFDAGRSVSLWVSAFEILAHDERRSDFGRVIAMLNRVEWLRPTLKTQDREVRSHNKGNPVRTNLAGELYRRLFMRGTRSCMAIH